MTTRSLAGELGESRCRGAGNGLGEVEEANVFALAEVLGAEKLGQADDVGAALRCFANVRDRRREVGLGIGTHSHLHQADIVFAGVFHISEFFLVVRANVCPLMQQGQPCA